MCIPVLETPRLTMRGHRIDDFNPLCAMWADPIVTRHIGGKPFTREESWARLLRYAGHWALLGFGFWAVEEKATGSFVGEVGFADFKRDIEPALEEVPETGWAFSSHVHGKGYAAEAVSAALVWGELHLKSKQTKCVIHPDNVASLRVAAKCGYREQRRTTYKGQPAILFSREHS